MEFLTALFNTVDKEEDIANCSELAKTLKIKVLPPRFRYSKSEYFMDKETNSIYKGLCSIKFMNSTIAEELYMLKNNKYNTFFDLLYDIISKTSLNTKQLDILVKLDFFDEFGNSRKLLQYINIFTFFKNGNAKVIQKSKVQNDNILEGIVRRWSNSTDKQYRDLRIDKILEECYTYIESINIKPFLVKEKIIWQKEFLGYIDFQTMRPEDKNKLLITSIKQLNSRRTGKLWRYSFKTLAICTGKVSEVLVDPRVYNKAPVGEYDVIFVDREWLHRETRGDYKSWVVDKYNIVIL